MAQETTHTTPALTMRCLTHSFPCCSLSCELGENMPLAVTCTAVFVPWLLRCDYLPEYGVQIMHGMPDFVYGQLLCLLQLPCIIKGLLLEEKVDLAGRI